MSEATVIKPDLEFVNEIIKGGGESLKKCYQCATCSVVCNVTPDGNPFPRKEMVLAQWGQKDKLIASADVWLCHQCSDCTAYCPRGAKPGEVLNAIRKQSIREVALIPFFAKIATDPKLIWLLFAIPAVLFYLIMPYKTFSGVPRNEHGEMAYHLFMPVFPHIDVTFILTALFAAFSAFMGIKKLWAGMKANAGGAAGSGSPFGHIVPAVTTILAHKKFADCNVNRLRQWGHLLLFYAFAGLAVVTTWAIVYLYGWEFLGIQASPALQAPLQFFQARRQDEDQGRLGKFALEGPGAPGIQIKDQVPPSPHHIQHPVPGGAVAVAELFHKLRQGARIPEPPELLRADKKIVPAVNL